MPILVFKVLFVLLLVIMPVVALEVAAFTGRILASSAQALYTGMFAAFTVSSVFTERWGWALVAFAMTVYKGKAWLKRENDRS